MSVPASKMLKAESDSQQATHAATHVATLEDLQNQIRTQAHLLGTMHACAASKAELADFELELAEAERQIALDEQREELRAEFQEEHKQQSEALAVVQANVAVLQTKVDAMWVGMYLPDQQRKERISAIQNDPIKKAYYDTASKALHEQLSGIEVIASERVKRERYTALDFVAAATKHIGEYLPFIGSGAAKTIAGVIKVASDIKELRNLHKIMDNAPLDHLKFSEEIGMGLAEDCCHDIANKKTAESVAKAHIKMVLETLKSTPAEDFADFNTPETLANQIVNLLDSKLKTQASAVTGKAITPALATHQQQETSAWKRFFGRPAVAASAPAKLAVC